MTTIVVDKRQRLMCSDNQNTLQNIAAPCQKVFRMATGPNKGTLVGTTGAPGPCFIFMNWFTHHTQHNFEEAMDDNAILGLTIPEDDFWCILLTPNNKMLLVDQFFCPEELPVPYFAVGSGKGLAIGALDAGATPQEAIKIACKRDVYTSLCGKPMQEEYV